MRDIIFSIYCFLILIKIENFSRVVIIIFKNLSYKYRIYNKDKNRKLDFRKSKTSNILDRALEMSSLS